VPVLLYKLYGARSNTIIQSLTPHNSMLNMSLVKHSVTTVQRLIIGLLWPEYLQQEHILILALIYRVAKSLQ